MAAMAADFWRLWGASTISSLGDGVRFAAIPLLAARLTHDPGRVALVTAAQGAAWVVFGLPSGALADRWDRRRTMAACDGLRCVLALTLAIAVAAGRGSIPLLMVIGFLLAATETFFYSAAQAALTGVLTDADLERGNGRMLGAKVLGEGFVGPPAGAALFVVAAAAPFALDAVTFGLAALLALSIRTHLSSPALGRRSLTAEVGQGLRWLWQHAELRTIMILLTIWNLAESAVFAVLVLWSLETLHLPEAGYGVLIAFLAGGGVAGSLLADRLSKRLGEGRAMAATVIVTAATHTGLGLTRWPAVAYALMAVIGLAAFVWNVITASFRQSVVPLALQGRVSSVYRFGTWGVMSVGALLGGATASRWGLQAPFLVTAAALATAGTLTLPRLTNARLDAARAAARSRVLDG
jgi:MFS family permease